MKEIDLRNELSSFKVRQKVQPGDMGFLIYLHGLLYAEEYGFNLSFETYVAEYLIKFVPFITARENIWIVEKNNEIVGSVAIVQFSAQEAQLRWLLVHPSVRGQGLGRTLITKAVEFCQKCNYSSVFLWTVNILTIASRLYQAMGFKKTEEKTHELWGTILTEERYELRLSDRHYSNGSEL